MTLTSKANKNEHTHDIVQFESKNMAKVGKVPQL